MAITKIPDSYVNNNAAWVPLRTVAKKLNETIDVVNAATDGTETFATVTATSSVITDTVSEYTSAAGVTIDGVLLKDSTVKTDTIIEKTATAGVTADGVLLKDGGVSANSSYAGFYKLGAVQALSGPGAINITSYSTQFTSTGTGDALTLASGNQIGLLKKISYVAEGAGGDTGVLTLTGYTSITFNAIGDFALLIWSGSAWIAIEYSGVTIV